MPQSLIEAARQGTLLPGTIYLDAQQNPCSRIQAIYTVQATFQPIAGIPMSAAETSSPTRLTLQVVPTGAPDRARIYAVVLPAP